MYGDAVTRKASGPAQDAFSGIAQSTGVPTRCAPVAPAGPPVAANQAADIDADEVALTATADACRVWLRRGPRRCWNRWRWRRVHVRLDGISLALGSSHLVRIAPAYEVIAEDDVSCWLWAAAPVPSLTLGARARVCTRQAIGNMQISIHRFSW